MTEHWLEIVGITLTRMSYIAIGRSKCGVERDADDHTAHITVTNVVTLEPIATFARLTANPCIAQEDDCVSAKQNDRKPVLSHFY